MSYRYPHIALGRRSLRPDYCQDRQYPSAETVKSRCAGTSFPDRKVATPSFMATIVEPD